MGLRSIDGFALAGALLRSVRGSELDEPRSGKLTGSFQVVVTFTHGYSGADAL